MQQHFEKNPVVGRDKVSQYRRELVDKTVFSTLTICACFLFPPYLFDRKDLFMDQEILESVSRTLMHLLGMVNQFENVFYENVVSLDYRHFMHDQVKVFRDFLLDMETGNYYEACSLLNILFLVVKRACEKWTTQKWKRVSETSLIFNEWME